MLQGGIPMQAIPQTGFVPPAPLPPVVQQPILARSYSAEFPRLHDQQPTQKMFDNNQQQREMMAQSQALIAQSQALAQAAQAALANPTPQATSLTALAAPPSTGKFQIQRTSSAETLLRDPKVHGFRLKASWCLLKDRVSVMTELRTAVKNYADAKSWSVVEQEKKAADVGIKFGVRSKSWAHFLRNDGQADENDIWGAPEKDKLPSRRSSDSSTKMKIHRTCSTGSLRPPAMPLRQCMQTV